MSSSSNEEFADLSEGELESISGEGAKNEEVVEEEVSVNSQYDDDDFEGYDRVKRQKVELFIKNRADCRISFLHGPHQDSEVSSKEDISKCKHAISYAGICVDCGGNKDDKSGVAFGYVHKNLRLRNDDIPPLRDNDIKNLLRQKKLCLVLDLDHTLLNSASHHDMTLKQNYYLYKTPEDCTQLHKKGLDIVLGKEKAVVILDDTEWVWEKHKENLMLIEEYHFFTWSRKAFVSEFKSLSEQKKDEEEADGPLASILRALKRIHNLFFDLGPTDTLEDRDVREVLKTVRKEVLKGCRIAFGRIFPDGFPAEHHQLLPKLAEQLGATCSEGPDPSVTHVVSRNSGTFEANWAIEEKKHLVNPKWIEAANCLWKRPPEEKFPVCR